MNIWRRTVWSKIPRASVLVLSVACVSSSLSFTPVKSSEDASADATSPTAAAIPAPRAAEGVGFPSPVGEVVRLIEARTDLEVVRAYIDNTRVPFALDAAQIIELKRRGVPADLIARMLQKSRELRMEVSATWDDPAGGRVPSTAAGPARATFSPLAEASDHGYADPAERGKSQFRLGDMVSVESTPPFIVLRNARIVGLRGAEVTVATRTDRFIFDASKVTITHEVPVPPVLATRGTSMMTPPFGKPPDGLPFALSAPSESPDMGSAGTGVSPDPPLLDPDQVYWIGGGYPAVAVAPAKDSRNSNQTRSQPEKNLANNGVGRSNTAIGKSNLSVGQPNIVVGKPNVSVGR